MPLLALESVGCQSLEQFRIIRSPSLEWVNIYKLAVGFK